MYDDPYGRAAMGYRGIPGDTGYRGMPPPNGLNGRPGRRLSTLGRESEFNYHY